MPGHGKLPAMAEKDGAGPSLELPSLGLGRKRGRKARDPAPEAAPAAGEPSADTTADTAGPPVAEPPAEPPPPIPEAEDRPTERLSPATPPAPAGKPLFADEAPTTRVDEAPVPPADRSEPEPAEDKPRREFALPSMGSRSAALVTGLLVGVLTVGVTWGGLRLCEVVRGTSSCGKPGFLLLLLIVIAMVLIGSMLLRAWEVPDPGSTSFLGVGLLTVLTLLFLVDVLFNWWMIIVIPVAAMITFVLADWVARAFVDLDD